MLENNVLLGLGWLILVVGGLILAAGWLIFVARLRWLQFHEPPRMPKIIGRIGSLGADMPGLGDEDDGQAAELEELNRVRKKYRHWRSEVSGADND